VRKLSAVIITLNEERNIGRCLASLHGVADDVVVVDSHSTDGTEALCRAAGARFVVTDWQGYAATKNYANSLAQHDLILSLDADEELSPALRQSLLALKQTLPDAPDPAQPPLYELDRLPNYCGRWIRHSGWYPDWKPRLFDRRYTHWVGDFIHETPHTTPAVPPQRLTGHLHHYTIQSLTEHLAVINKYSDLQAAELRRRGKRAAVWQLLVKPPAEFFISYVLKRGFLDGRMGFIVSSMNALGKFMKYAKRLMLRG